MLELVVPSDEGPIKLQFEHSLRSLSKWEEKFKKAFYGSAEKRPTEMLEYFQCMLLTPDVDPNLIFACSPDQLEQLGEYINEDRTASSVPDEGGSKYDSEVRTSELIYYWMSALKINWEAQDWHLSRLMMLVRITSYKQQTPKKRNPVEVMADWASENERRQQLFKTSG